MFGKRTRERDFLSFERRYNKVVRLDDFPTSRRTLFGVAASAAAAPFRERRRKRTSNRDDFFETHTQEVGQKKRLKGRFVR